MPDAAAPGGGGDPAPPPGPHGPAADGAGADATSDRGKGRARAYLEMRPLDEKVGRRRDLRGAWERAALVSAGEPRPGRRRRRGLTGPARPAAPQGPDGRPWWSSVRKRDLPPEFWEARRKAKNRRRSDRYRANVRARPAPHASPAEQRERQLAAQQQVERVQAALRDEAGPQICVECDFEGVMSAKEIRSLYKQLEFVSAGNKRAAKPVNVTVCSFKGALAAYAGSLTHAAPWKAVNLSPKSVLERHDPARIVVLSPDAPAPLALGAGGLQPGTAYCVGGIVDRTVKGDQTKDWAARHRLQTAHLPIREHLPGVNPSQTVLNVNAVVDVLLHVHAHGDWAQALALAFPKR